MDLRALGVLDRREKGSDSTPFGQASSRWESEKVGPLRLHFGPCHKPISTSRHSRRDSRVATEISALRRFRCALCGVLALVCRFCDRGQIYCAHECSQIARRDSLRRASVRHQASREGRRNHAARQTHYRESRRELQKVTHQGPPSPSVSLLPAVTGHSVSQSAPAQEVPDVRIRVPVLPSSLVILQATTVAHSNSAAASSASAARIRSRSLSTEGNYFCDFCGVSQSRFLRRDPIVICRRRGIPRRPS